MDKYPQKFEKRTNYTMMRWTSNHNNSKKEQSADSIYHTTWQSIDSYKLLLNLKDHKDVNKYTNLNFYC